MLWKCRDRLLDLDRDALVMGILNVTPDSFSDGGRFNALDSALQQAECMVAEGADILDVGGESSRPGAKTITLEEELARVVPVVRELASRFACLISIDTTKAEVARQCLAEGAHIINDITGLTGDAKMVNVAKESGAGLVVMHMQGVPETMHLNPQYGDVVAEVLAFLKARIADLIGQGIAPDTISVDPGIGFGKTNTHSLKLLRHLSGFQSLGRPLCLGVSRKGFIGKATGKPVEERMVGSVAVACRALTEKSAQIFRVHDVGPTKDMVRMLQAIERAE